MLKRRGTPSPLGLARAAPLGFSRKKKGSAAFTLFSLFLFSFLLLFILSSSSFNFLPLSSLFLFSNFFSKRKILKKNRKTSEKRNFRRNLALFLYSTFSLLSLPSSSLFCAVSFLPRPRIASRTTYLSAAFYFIVCFLEALCVFYCVSAVKESAGLVWFCSLLCSLCGGLVVNDCHHTYQKKRSLFLILMPRFILSLSCLCSQSSLVMVVVVMVGADQTRPLF